MKALCAVAAVGLSLISFMGSVSAQPYGDRGYGDRDRGFRDRGGDFEDQDDDDRGGGGFDESEYLRCYPDVRRAVERGTMPSGAFHYERFGRKEGRRLTC